MYEITCTGFGHEQTTISRVSFRVLNGGNRIRDLRAGADIGFRRLQAAIRWFDDNWPDGAVWPKAVKRPSLIKAAS